MPSPLLTAVSSYVERHGDPAGLAQTLIPGLSAIRSTSPSGLIHGIPQPLVCLVLQGRKQVTMGAETFDFGAGDSLLITADVPTVSQITEASETEPYYSLVLHLDLAVLGELVLHETAEPGDGNSPITVSPTDEEVTETALRLMRLLERPGSLSVLHDSLVKELHHWLLSGRHGALIRQLGYPDASTRKVAPAIALVRKEFRRTLPIEQLAGSVGMSPSSFHQHFKTATSLTPLQFQKQLRLIEGRRLIMSEGMSASSTAFKVGYESISQFTREYRRMFGLPPARDRDAARSRIAGEALIR